MSKGLFIERALQAIYLESRSKNNSLLVHALMIAQSKLDSSCSRSPDSQGLTAGSKLGGLHSMVGKRNTREPLQYVGVLSVMYSW
jgi:hypothetical protein